MDTLMDKLAQKFTAQEMIKANAAAEAAELQRTRDQVKKYNDCLQEMKQVNDETKEILNRLEAAVAEGKTELVRCGLDRMQELTVNAEAIQSAMQAGLDSKTAEITDFVHKENVKVYRNVQAVVVDETKKQSEELTAKLDQLVKKQGKTAGVAVAAMIFALLSVAGWVVQMLIIYGVLTV